MTLITIGIVLLYTGSIPATLAAGVLDLVLRQGLIILKKRRSGVGKVSRFPAGGIELGSLEGVPLADAPTGHPWPFGATLRGTPSREPSSIRLGTKAGTFPNTLRSFKPAVVWFTGLSGSGKSTLGHEVVTRLRAQGLSVEHLDGDTIREIFPGTGFDRASREEHVKRVGFLARALEQKGVFVVASLISPYESSRNAVRGMCSNFIEVYVDTPLEECERRDVKGLYKRARAGELKNFTGINDPYEAPRNPELRLDTAAMTVDQAVDCVFERVSEAGDRAGARG